MNKRLVFELTSLPYPIRLYQTAKNRFIVKYGEQIDSGLTVGDASDRLGRSIMHALQCDGKLDNPHD